MLNDPSTRKAGIVVRISFSASVACVCLLLSGVGACSVLMDFDGAPSFVLVLDSGSCSRGVYQFSLKPGLVYSSFAFLAFSSGCDRLEGR